LPADLGLKIELTTQNSVVDAATFIVTSNGGPVTRKTIELSSIGGFSQADFAPIVGFQVVPVGPDNGACAFLSAGSGKITYEADQPLTPQAGDPLHGEAAGVTVETANTAYQTLSSTPSRRITQTFSLTHEQQQ
jgi:hypothetical protein